MTQLTEPENHMTETLERTEAPPKDEWKPSNHGKRLAASRLRIIADWLDSHEVFDHEILNASTDGWDDLHVHVKPETFARLMAGREFRVDKDGHTREPFDGILLVAILR
jgi:hypothetical protein